MSFAYWQRNYFSAAQLADPTISGPSADPYGSGVPNLLAYALLLDPAAARSSDVPHAVASNGHLYLSYYSWAIVTDVSFVVEVSTDLQTWHSGPGYTTTITDVTDSRGGHTVVVQDTLPGSARKHFMRLRVTQP
jgi:hypothetical protein